jgi:DNA-directed RNA polymerase subunit RPC12/RpoP
MRKFKEDKQEFMKKNYLTCKYCGYNNEKARFLQYGVCLKCGKILDEKTYFMIQMMKRINDNKRRKG